MSEARRDESDTPRAESRSFTGDDGRRWSGVVMSGRFAGGEDHAEVIFVCEDTPSETKRFARLDSPPAEAAEQWRSMPEEEMRVLLRDSEAV
ncbi:MAG TPA: hypothetical protein VFZ69_12650 [Longimicrobiales bacterium]